MEQGGSNDQFWTVGRLLMDVDENPNTACAFGIMSIPTLLFKKDGQVVKQVAGVHTADQIKAIVAELS